MIKTIAVDIGNVSVFIDTFCYAWCGCFLGTLIWNTVFYRWPIEWWGIKFFITGLLVPGIIAVISTVWFAIGGSIDLYRLFKRLDAKVADDTDDGTVEKDEEK